MSRFRKTVQLSDEIVMKLRGWSPMNTILEPTLPDIAHTLEQQYFHEVILQIALFELYGSWQLKPDAVMGIKTGEIAAAYAAEGLSFEEAFQVAGVFCDASFNQDSIDTEQVRQKLSFLPGRVPVRPLYSCVIGGKVTRKLDASYWAEILRSPIALTSTASQLLKDGYDVLLQIGGPDHYLAEVVESLQPFIDRKIYVMPVKSAGENFGLISVTSKATLQHLGLLKSLPPQAPQYFNKESSPPLELRSDFFSYDPYFCFRSWRKIGPVHYLPEEKAWLVLDYDDIVSILRQPKLYSAELYKKFSSLVSGNDPPDHTRVRNLLSPHFGRDEGALSEITRRHLESTIERLKLKPGFEVMEELARPLPLLVMCEFLGIDPSRSKQFHTATKSNLSMDELRSFLGDTNGVLQEMLAKRDFTDEEILELAPFFLKAGVNTVTDAIGNSIYTLLHYPEIMEEVRQKPELVPALVEELLRLGPAVFIVQRKALKSANIGGVQIREGALIFMPIGAANRDLKHFHDPDRLILNRKNSKPLTFGIGPHYCMGSHIGLLELEIVLRGLLTQLPAFHSTLPLENVKFHGGIFIREPAELLITFDSI